MRPDRVRQIAIDEDIGLDPRNPDLQLTIPTRVNHRIGGEEQQQRQEHGPIIRLRAGMVTRETVRNVSRAPPPLGINFVKCFFLSWCYSKRSRSSPRLPRRVAISRILASLPLISVSPRLVCRASSPVASRASGSAPAPGRSG